MYFRVERQPVNTAYLNYHYNGKYITDLQWFSCLAVESWSSKRIKIWIQVSRERALTLSFFCNSTHKKLTVTVLAVKSRTIAFETLRHLNYGNVISPQFPILIILDIIYAYYVEQNKYIREGMHDSTLCALEE